LSSGERSSARLFVAVDPPAEVCRELGGWARAVAAEGFAGAAGRPRAHQRGPAHPELRVLDAEGLHITLCFLGSRPVEEIEELSFAVTSCSGEVDELSVGAPLWLPPRHPRALAVEIHDASGELERLQRELTAALRDAVDWQPGHRRFRAHLTVARVRGFGPFRAMPCQSSSCHWSANGRPTRRPSCVCRIRCLLRRSLLPAQISIFSRGARLRRSVSTQRS